MAKASGSLNPDLTFQSRNIPANPLSSSHRHSSCFLILTKFHQEQHFFFLEKCNGWCIWFLLISKYSYIKSVVLIFVTALWKLWSFRILQNSSCSLPIKGFNRSIPGSAGEIGCKFVLLTDADSSFGLNLELRRSRPIEERREGFGFTGEGSMISWLSGMVWVGFSS